jgi:hypothetical protein
MPRDPWSDWQRFSKYASKRMGYERLESDSALPLELYAPDTPPSRFFYFTKPALVRHWLAKEGLPPKTAIVFRAGLPTRGTLTLLRSLSAQWSVPITFVGDLRPLDLTVYSFLIRGWPPTRSRKGVDLALQYGGIHEPWIALCRAFVRRQIDFDHLLIRMSPVESEHMEVVERLLPGMEKTLGAMALELLRAGYTFHLEGACNPAAYRKGFIRALTRLLLARPATARE